MSAYKNWQDGHSSSDDEETEKLLDRMADLPTKMGQSTDELVPLASSKKVMQYIGALCATLGGLSLGTSLAWTSPAFAVPDNATDTVSSNFDFEVSESDQSWIGALLPLGAAFVAFPIGFLMDYFGRKIAMLMTVVPFTVGWALIIWASSVPMMMAGRFIIGIAGGAFAVAAPAYTSEIAENSVRGALGSYFQLMVTIGILLVYIFGGAEVSMFAISLICGIIPLIFGVLFFFMPDTPTWYLSKGRTADAKRSLEFFRGKNFSNLQKELDETREAVEKAQREKASLMTAFSTAAAKKALVIALALMLIQQFSGVNAVIFYTAKIFASAGSTIKASISTIIVGVVQFVSCFVSTLVVDRLGRKILLLASAAVMCICSLLLGVFFYLKDDGQDVEDIGWLPLLSLCLFITMFSMGFGPIPWMIVAELFLPQTKGVASSLASCFNWILAFLVTKFFSDMVNSIGTGPTFWVFMAILFCGTVFVFFVVKETKGKSFDEIQRELGA